MDKIVRIERYRRGFFGWIFRIFFVGFNVLMLIAIIVYSLLVAFAAPDKHDLAGRIGAALYGNGFLIAVWIPGALLLGVLSYVTRGNKVIIEETEAR